MTDLSRLILGRTPNQVKPDPAQGFAPVEATVVSATATQVVVTIYGFSSDATYTCNYTTQYAWNGSANVAVLPARGTKCLVAFPPATQDTTPWVVAFLGQSAPTTSSPATTLASVGVGSPPPAGTPIQRISGSAVATTSAGSGFSISLPTGFFSHGYNWGAMPGDNTGNPGYCVPVQASCSLTLLVMSVFTPTGAGLASTLIRVNYWAEGA